jgi:multiple sugar transport system ATP-binding protein
VHLHINVGGKDCIIIAPRLDLDTGNLAVGSKIRFTLAPNAVHVFDPETEKNLERI